MNITAPDHDLSTELIKLGVKPAHLAAAGLRAAQSGEDITTALSQQRLASSEQIAKAIAATADLPYWSFQQVMGNDFKTVRELLVDSPILGIPLSLDTTTGVLTLAVPTTTANVASAFAGYDQKLVIASTRSLQHVYRRIFAGTEETYRRIAAKIFQFERTSSQAEMAESIPEYRKLFVALLRHACYLGGNDLELKISSGFGNIRLVVDGLGLLFDVVSEKTLGTLITIAMRSTDKNEENIKKEIFGEASFDEGGLSEDVLTEELAELRSEYDFRLNFGRAKDGPTLVIRFLSRDTESLAFDQLGIDSEDQITLLDAVASNSGLLVITGPTGSSKTTTRFSILSQIDALERSVQTAENPVEYRHPLWLQYQTRGVDEDTAIEVVFRGILRNGPKVIDIAEVRSASTVHTMIRAAATGHLVCTTLHADDATLAIYMLRKLGVDDEDLAANLQIVLGVRLVRRLCPTCRLPEDRPTALRHIGELENECGVSRPATGLFYSNHLGCAQCTAGYRSRFMIYELLEVKDAVAAALRSHASASVIRALAIPPAKSLRGRGLTALHKGITSIDELIRTLPRRRY